MEDSIEVIKKAHSREVFNVIGCIVTTIFSIAAFVIINMFVKPFTVMIFLNVCVVFWIICEFVVLINHIKALRTSNKMLTTIQTIGFVVDLIDKGLSGEDFTKEMLDYVQK